MLTNAQRLTMAKFSLAGGLCYFAAAYVFYRLSKSE